MHGIIHAELKKFVEAKHGAEAWRAILAEAGLPNKMYLSNSVYPDTETVALVTAASKLTGTPADAILEAYGEFIAPTLMRMFQSLVKPQWKTMEMLLNTEDTIHKVVRIRNPGAAPPRLQFEQKGPNKLLFKYDSPRRRAAVARGIMKGVAAHYGETISIRERRLGGDSVEMDITIG